MEDTDKREVVDEGGKGHMGSLCTILLIFLCLENKRSDHRNKGEGEISFLGDFKKYHCLSVLEKRRVVTWGREEGQGHPWMSLNGRNPGLGDLEKGDAGP